MIVYGSAIETVVPATYIQKLEKEKRLNHLLLSYYYLRKSKTITPAMIKDCIIDSGAHSFQKGVKVDWDAYTREYAEWIAANDAPNIRGYFEMDVDNVLSYEKVLQLRHVLETVSGHPEKIIPVWHKNRGVKDFQQTVAEHPIAAVTGFLNEDIKDNQYLMFLKTAWQHDCWLHGLGLTRRKVLDRVPFDSVDSSSWKQAYIYGNYHGHKLTRNATRFSGTAERTIDALYTDLEQMQAHYLLKWRNIGVHNHPPIERR